MKRTNRQNRLDLQGIDGAVGSGNTRHEDVAKLNEGDRRGWVIYLVG